ncbi:MAG: hypothetical protein M3Y13_07085, partial [Armatimonadota bacterium]|nr:hypothetical protein [Armatimonadota bacterium]
TGLPQYRNLEPALEGLDSANRFGRASQGGNGASVLDRPLNDEDLAVIREATGTAGESLSLLAERENLAGLDGR